MTDRWVLQIDRMRDNEGRLVLVARGEMDMLSSRLLHNAIKHAHRPGDTLVLDLADVGFIDSTGIHVLIKAARDADRDGWSLVLRPELRMDVAKALRLAGCSDTLPWEGGLPRALRASD